MMYDIVKDQVVIKYLERSGLIQLQSEDQDSPISIISLFGLKKTKRLELIYLQDFMTFYMRAKLKFLQNV